MDDDFQDKAVAGNRSEEVQAIIDRMPTYWAKWFALGVFCLMGIIIVLGFVIKYPDTVDGEISITGIQAPVRLVANAGGRIILIAPNRQQMSEGDVIAYIANGADYRHILKVESLLGNLHFEDGDKYPLPDSLLLGDVSGAYNSFYVSYMQYCRILESDIYDIMRVNLEKKIDVDMLVTGNLEVEISLKENILQEVFERLQKDSILYKSNGISKKEYMERRSNYLLQKESLIALRSNYLLKQSEINHSRMEIQRLHIEETESKEKALSELVAHQNSLSNAISLWKEQYLQFSPISGELEYLGFWKNNSFVKAGQELFTVIPSRNDIVGEVMIPSYGAGKVKVGQTANIKINNYPYEEFGMIKGKVHSLSRLTNKMETPNGMIDVYLVEIIFPNGLITNFGKQLPLDFETKGSVEIITKPKRLIERLFDNLKSKGEK